MREYRSRWGMFTTDLLVGKKYKHIVFTTLRLGGSYYATDDEDVIHALESDSAFGKDFYLFSKKEPKKTNKKEKLSPDDKGKPDQNVGAPSSDYVGVDNISNNDSLHLSKDVESNVKAEAATIVEGVTNINEAREYLKKIGIDYRKLNTPNAISKQATEANILFPNLK